MNKYLFSLMTFLFLSLAAFCQEEKTEVSYYNGNRVSLSLFTNHTFYPEIQVESDNLKIQDAKYAFLLRNDVPVKELFFSWGVGCSYSDDDDTYLVLPFELKKKDILKEHISLSIGVEVSSNFDASTRVKPLAGISISF